MSSTAKTTTGMTAVEIFAANAKVYEVNTGGTSRRVAKHIVPLIGPYDSSATVLDNATGPGIVVEELFAYLTDPSQRDSVHVTAVDAAPPMIEIVKAKSELNGWKNVTAAAMSGEDLSALRDESFSHSFTNFGIFFFKDTRKGASEIYRTMKSGGKAIVTAWSDLSYVRVWQKADREVRVDRRRGAENQVKEEDYVPVKLPFDDRWYEASYLEQVMREAGFKNVEVHQVDSWFEGESTEQLATSIHTFVSTLPNEYTQQEKDEVMLPLLIEYMKEIVRPSSEGNTVGFKTVAHVAICTK
jgi:ubiquinone/menaquinone biosynthesis C-methylase UbiE